MPTYQYECGACGHSFEYLQTMLDKKLTQCPQCKKQKLQRLIGSGSGIIFKGTGFYETDYKKSKGSTEGGEPKKNDPPATPACCQSCEKAPSCASSGK